MVSRMHVSTYTQVNANISGVDQIPAARCVTSEVKNFFERPGHLKFSTSAFFSLIVQSSTASPCQFILLKKIE